MALFEYVLFRWCSHILTRELQLDVWKMEFNGER
jgi:hypothetical protein